MPVMRADTARYLYMHAHGGVYADLDTWALRGMDNLTAAAGRDTGALLGLMSEASRFEAAYSIDLRISLTIRAV